MTFPREDAIQQAILEELQQMGGEAPFKQLLPRITTSLRAKFPDFTQADLNRTDPIKGFNSWEHRVHSVRSRMVKTVPPRLDPLSPHGVWRIPQSSPLPPQPQFIPPTDDAKRTAMRPAAGEHDDLQKVIAEMGRKLGKTVEIGSGVDYKHDVLWKDNPYRVPTHVWEICDRGNLDKDVAALTLAADPQKWGAKAILVVTGDNDYSNAQKKLAGKPVLVVRSDVVKRTAELVNSGDAEFVKSIFS